MKVIGWVLFALGLAAVPVAAWMLRAPATVELPRFGTMPSLPLVTQDGQPFDPTTLVGKVRVVDFIFTRCAQICPRLTDEVQRLQTTLAAQRIPVQILSISVDPENDTPAALKDFAAKHHAELGNWTFLTGTQAQIDAIVVRGFKQGIDRALSDGGVNVIHGTRLVLVDDGGSMRGLYDTTDAAAMSRLVDDIRRLGARP